MGQYSAMVAAGVLDLGDALRLVRERGRLMQASSGDGAMAAVIGLPDERLEDLVAAGSGHGILTVANRNSPGQVVISGQRAAVEAAVERRQGPRGPPAPSCCRSAWRPTRRSWRRPLPGCARPSRPSPSTTRAPRCWPTPTPRSSPPARPAGPSSSSTSPEASTGCAAVEAMAGAGVRTFVEVGPGKVLAGLVKRIDSEATIIAIDDITTEGGLVLPADPNAQE